MEKIPRIYYESCESYIKCILESGLLLDEDLDSLSPHYDFDYDKSESRKANISLFKLGITGVSAAACLYFLQKGGSGIHMLCSISPSVVIGVDAVRRISKKRNHIYNIRTVIGALQQISLLNRCIEDYLRHRIIASQSHGDAVLFIPYTSRVKLLLKFVSEIEILLLHKLKLHLWDLSTRVPSLNDSCIYLSQIDFDMFKVPKMKTIEQAIAFHQKFAGMFILFTSHFLRCLGVSLCPSLWGKEDLNVEKLLNELTPELKEATLECHKIIRSAFRSAKFDIIDSRSEVYRVPRDIGGLSKLERALTNSVSNAAILLEKSKAMFDAMEKLRVKNRNPNEPMSSELMDHLLNLRNCTSDYYETLDVMCKMYEATVNTAKAQSVKALKESETEATPDNRETQEVEEVKPEVISLISKGSTKDEEYELYLREDEPVEGSNFFYSDEDESAKFATLMVQELKLSLKADKRFTAAREKRGIVDEPIVPKQTKASTSKSQIVDEQNGIDHQQSEPEHVTKTPTAIPPPPPPPNFDFVDSSDEELFEEGTSFLKAIRGEFSKMHIGVDFIESV